MHDSFGAAVFDFIKSPLENYHKYRSLYKLEDIENSDEDDIAEDVIWALRDVSFDVKQGEVLGIIGRSGAAKELFQRNGSTFDLFCSRPSGTGGIAHR